MEFWTALLLAWVGSNVVIVALLSWHHWRRHRESALHRSAAAGRQPGNAVPPPVAPSEAPSPRRQHRPALPPGLVGPNERTRIVSLASGEASARAQRRPAHTLPPSGGACTHGAPASCPVLELHDEIRTLKLTVAELSLDRAMLRAAASRHRQAMERAATQRR